MKNVVIALAVFLFASAAQASTTIKKFVSLDDTVASNLCVIAAEDGYKKAVDHAKQYGENYIKAMTCNGKGIQRFSKSFEIKEVSSKEVLVIPANNSIESNLCALAVKDGLKLVISSTDIDVSQTICNGQQIAHFCEALFKFLIICNSLTLIIFGHVFNVAFFCLKMTKSSQN